ncbi:hypothetical protein Tco_1138005, partial [Tanacetum coccineum]
MALAGRDASQVFGVYTAMQYVIKDIYEAYKGEEEEDGVNNDNNMVSNDKEIWARVENKTIHGEDVYVCDDVYNNAGIVLPPKEINASILKPKTVK